MPTLRILCICAFSALLSLSSCKPDITSNTYFCGPEGVCPPELQCQRGSQDSFAYNCVTALSVEDFACPAITLDREPDDTADDAYAIGALQCGDQLSFTDWGCVAQGADVDHFLVQTEGVCSGPNPRFTANLRYPVGSAPLLVELLSSDGTLIATSVLCTAVVDTTGTDQQCIEEPNLPSGEYYLRVSIDAAGNADCDGNCRFNRYQLFAASPLI